MLHLYQSNRLESLAGMLNAVHRLRPPAEPLASEHIMVQSQGMRRYLNRFLAEQNGIAANLQYSLPAGFTWQLMRKALPDTPALNPFSPEVMRWRLFSLFSDGISGAPQAAAELSGYLRQGEKAAYDLAGQMADIFDHYLVYRPAWIESWQAGKLNGLGEDEVWQAELWRLLSDREGRHRVALWQELLHRLNADMLPERLSVFGIATLAPMYLELLKAVSQYCEVHIFALNPSSGYWGNVIEPARLLACADQENTTEAAGHPLLASLGKQGRDFFDALSEVGAQQEISAYENDDGNDGAADGLSLLHRLQHDIQTLSLPQAASLLDGSIRLLAAHSPLRELQILKEHILHELHEHPDWQPHDIAVLTPNIEAYLPFVEAVFGQAAPGSPALPYSLSDTKLSRRQALLHAMEQAVALMNSRFEADKVLSLLENETVLRRFGLSPDDLPLIRDTVGQLNIRWGADGIMRGSGDTQFTWQQGLERIVLGWLLPEQPQNLWQGISPFPCNPNHTAVLARFTAFVRTLSAAQREWQQPACASEWTERVRRLRQNLCTPSENDHTAQQHLEQNLARWQEETALAGFDRPLSRETAERHLARLLSAPSESGFLRQGITFCGMVPMRSLPFKMLCLIGLNDSDFPRNTKAAAFDLIAKHPKRGDRSRRDDDRYLFLEALMSAREKLYLSYIGRHIRTNEELSPSALINELNDVLADMTGRTPADIRAEWTEYHPLQDFSRRYFDHSRPLGLRSDYAAALNLPQRPPAPFYPDTANSRLSENLPAADVSQHDFTGFWRNPVRRWLEHTLDWKAPRHAEQNMAEEPFEPDSQTLSAQYILARRNKEDFSETSSRLQAQSQLPAGEIGKIWQEKHASAAKSLDSKLLASPSRPAFAYRLELENGSISGSLENLFADGIIRFASDAPNAPDRIAFYLEHLLLNAVSPPACARQSHWLAAAHSETLPALLPETARTLLDTWLHYYRLGQNQPLPFFPKTSLAAAEAMCNASRGKTPEEAAAEAARTAYFGGRFSTGQKDYAEISLVFSGQTVAPIDQPLFAELYDKLLVPTLLAFIQ
ncbi:MAG: exodeoxyribonuclease V subunit gamma [Neisseria sp.]|nr:exodeoxyribonuclease V subunit gamma [Neisseria sp.]